MESQPQNPEFRINPENVHPCISPNFPWYPHGKLCSVRKLTSSGRVDFTYLIAIGWRHKVDFEKQ